MPEPATLTLSALSLVFILGLRHGLDPDHVAVIDAMTFRAAEERPRLARHVGTLFAIGHSLSVAVVAASVGWLSGLFRWPAGLAGIVDWLVVALLIFVGVTNLRALLHDERYVPVGWRQRLVPARWRRTAHPGAIIATGAVFGLVFDTMTQAAAWGAASGAGTGGALGVAGVFAAGMILTDTIDSRIVAHLLLARGDRARVAQYRRGVGWVIVALSFAMAGYSFATILTPALELPDAAFNTVGFAMMFSVIAVMVVAGRKRRALRVATSE